ncbi:MAG: general secretion pathway protein GspB [Halieaceae bacterium]|nr:general secretion pathway protein GspB [Halieaceae bacterium]
MSLILDALNRSRNDAQQVPGLATSYDVGSSPRTTGWRGWLLPGALVVAVLLIIWLLWERSGDRAAAPPAESPAPAPGAAAIAPAPVPASPPAGPAPTAEPAHTAEPEPVTAPAVASVPAMAAAERGGAAAAGSAPLPGAGVATPADSAAEVAEGSARRADSASASASVAALYRQQQLARREVPAAASAKQAAGPEVYTAAEPAAPAARAVQEQPIDIGELLEMAEDELENARLAEHPAPFLSALSQQTKDTIPTLLYQAHDYTGRKADSFVLINGKTLKPGDSSKGVRVDEILPDSVVLSFQGTQFRLRALNSWVNL